MDLRDAVIKLAEAVKLLNAARVNPGYHAIADLDVDRLADAASDIAQTVNGVGGTVGGKTT